METEVVGGPDYRGAWMEREYKRLIVIRMNELYYSRLAAKLQARSRWLSIGSAAFSSAAVVGFLQQYVAAGAEYAALLSACGALVAIIGSGHAMGPQIGAYEKAAMGYGIARARLVALLTEVQLRDYQESDAVRAKEVQGIVDALLVFDDAPQRKLLEQCQRDAERAWPSVESVA